jgi:hypothetical protein
MVTFAVQEDLGLAVKPAEGCPVNDPIPVSLVAGTKGMLRLGPEPPDTLRGALRLGSQKGFARVRGHEGKI